MAKTKGAHTQQTQHNGSFNQTLDVLHFVLRGLDSYANRDKTAIKSNTNDLILIKSCIINNGCWTPFLNTPDKYNKSNNTNNGISYEPKITYENRINKHENNKVDSLHWAMLCCYDDLNSRFISSRLLPSQINATILIHQILGLLFGVDQHTDCRMILNQKRWTSIYYSK